MRQTSTVVAIITLACGLVAAGTVSAQFGPIGTQGSLPRGGHRMRTGEQNQARETQAAGTAAAMAAAQGVAFRAVNTDALRSQLKSQGAVLS